MIAAVIILGLVIAALLVLRDRERQAYEQTTRSLLDRIQHPEIRQVQPFPSEPVDPPKDAAEMAFLGEQVPEGYEVGHELTDAEKLAIIGQEIKVGGSD